MNLTLSLKAFLLFLPPRVGTFSTRLISITGNLRVEPTRFSSEGIQPAIFVMDRGWNVLWWVTERSIYTVGCPHSPNWFLQISILWVSLGGESGQCSETSKYTQIQIAGSCLLLPSQMWRSVLYTLMTAKRWLFNCVLSMTLLLSCKLLSSLIQWNILRSCKAKYILYRNPGNIYIYTHI